MFCGFGKEAFPAILDFAEKCKNLITAGLVHNYYLSLISIAGIGAFSMIFMAGINSIIQLNSADEYRGRAMSMYSLVLIGTTPIGNFFTGVITEKLGADTCFAINGVLTALLLFILFIVIYI